MTRTMYDGIIGASLPEGARLYAAYDNGRWPDAQAVADRFPGITLVRISVDPTSNVGDVLDVETGNSTAQQAVSWVLMRRMSHADPSLYCSVDNWPTVQAAFNTHDVPQPHYWVARWDGDPTIPEGAVAKQYASSLGYDTSSVADYWPGVDPAPAPAYPPWPGRQLHLTEPHMTGADIAIWQARMIKRGWDLGPTGADGNFGPITDRVCAAFQTEKHLAVDRTVGPVTWDAAYTLPITSD